MWLRSNPIRGNALLPSHVGTNAAAIKMAGTRSHRKPASRAAIIVILIAAIVHTPTAVVSVAINKERCAGPRTGDTGPRSPRG